MRSTLFVLLLFLSTLSLHAKNIDVHENIRWKVIVEGKFVDYHGEVQFHSIHLPLDLTELRGLRMQLNSPSLFYIFVDGSLISKVQSSITLSLDSLIKEYPKPTLLTLYSKNSLAKVKSRWIYSESEFFNPKRELSGFPSLVVGVTVMLLVFITALLRTNPRLTQDYLNITRLFRLRDRDEGQMLRITSSVNLLFYFFCSALASLALIIATHSSDEISFIYGLSGASSRDFWEWIILSVMIFFVMMVKLLISTVVSNLFGWKDIASVQFFNFIRMVILSLAIIAAISLAGFSFGFSMNYLTLLKFACILLALGAILIYIKLLTRATFHFVHLFFYLCATEVLPLVILVKILLY